MAGAGYKLFNTGDVLTAAQVNTYLMEQTVMVFADAAARTTALTGVLAEGMISYLKDTNATEVYNGSAWVGITGDGDITGVTAGTGLSGGGTTGTVTLTNDVATTFDAKGDLVVGTGSDTYAKRTVGSNETRLVADSTETTGVKWVADTTNYVIAAKGDLLAGTAADTVAALTVGANNTVLTADSSTATGLKWATASSGGGMTLITSTTASNSASISFTSISGSYKDLRLVVRNFKPATDSQGLWFRFNADSSANRHAYVDWSGNDNAASFNTDFGVVTSTNDNSVASGLAILVLFDYANATTWKIASAVSISVDSSTTTNYRQRTINTYYNQTSAITSISLFSSSGNITSGTFELYGVS